MNPFSIAMIMLLTFSCQVIDSKNQPGQNPDVNDSQDLTSLDNNGFQLSSAYTTGKFSKWNSQNEASTLTIFWKPAEKNGEIYKVNKYGDQIASVLGRPPAFDCSTGYSHATKVDGRTVSGIVDYKGKKHFKLVAQNDPKDVKYLREITQCDNPSLAEGITHCGNGGFLKSIPSAYSANVSWVILCRKNNAQSQKVEADKKDSQGNPDFWSNTNYEVNLLGYIGHNNTSGEVGFFDSTETQNINKSIKAPGGSGYHDSQRPQIAVKWNAPVPNSPFAKCAECHQNNNPWTSTPYLDGFTLPAQSYDASLPFRPVGKDFVVNRFDSYGDKYLTQPTECLGCHTLTDGAKMKAFAKDATAMSSKLKPNQPAPDEARLIAKDQLSIHSRKNNYSWMQGGNGTLNDALQSSLDACLDDPNCKGNKIFTSCPAPEQQANTSTRLADPHAPDTFGATVANNRDNDNQTYKKEITAKWKYLNGLGSVKTRDDVRFDLKIKQIDMTGQNTPWPEPGQNDFPNPPPQTFGEGPEVVTKEDISYWQHWEDTDPSPTTQKRNYQVSFPAKCHHRYLFVLQAKRFCFDDAPEINYSLNQTGHRWHVDVPCPTSSPAPSDPPPPSPEPSSEPTTHPSPAP